MPGIHIAAPEQQPVSLNLLPRQAQLAVIQIEGVAYLKLTAGGGIHHRGILLAIHGGTHRIALGLGEVGGIIPFSPAGSRDDV